MPDVTSQGAEQAAVNPAQPPGRDGLVTIAAIMLALLTTYFYLAAAPLNHDVAWLLTATQRWVSGQQLYVDIIEVNPPLIFLENLLITGGLLTKQAYLAGVTACIGVSAGLVLLHKGPRLAAIATAAMIASGFNDYGQRDHLALIFLVPLLLDDPPGKSWRAAIGAWAFLGVGLKPHFALIPAAFIAARCWQAKSMAPLRETQFVVLALLCIAWLAIAVLVWPAYFMSIIPLASFVYQAFGEAPLLHYYAISIIPMCLVAVVAERQPLMLPLAVAGVAAVAEFFLQGRFWTYQFVPALGLTIIVCLEAGLAGDRAFKWALLGAGTFLVAYPLWIGPHRYHQPVLPQGVKTVLFLSDRVWAAYPFVVECGATNASRYPTFWTLPGAWNRLQGTPEEQAEAREIWQKELANIDHDIRSARPEIIFEDRRPRRFDDPAFSFSKWVNLDGYRPAGDRDRYRVWLRNDLDPAIMNGPACRMPGAKGPQ